MQHTNSTMSSNKKVAIRFVLILFTLYLLLSQGNLFMNSVVNPQGRFYNEFISQHLNYIQGIRYALIYPATWIIKLFGYHTIHNGMEVLVVNGPNLNINYSCLGLGVMSFLIAFVVAFPAKIKSKYKMIITGVVMIYFLNIIRIAGLGIMLTTFPSQRKYFGYHHEIFNIFLYIVLLFMLYKWIKAGMDKEDSSLK